MNLFDWFVPTGVRGDPQKIGRHRGITKSLLAISLVTALVFIAFLFVHRNLPATEFGLFAVSIITPALGALLIRGTGDITLGLVSTNIAGILIVAVWAFLSGGIVSVVSPIFLANIALLSTFGNVAILLVTAATLAGTLVFLYAATVTGWLPASLVPQSTVPLLMLITTLGAVAMVVLAGIVVHRERSNAKARLRAARDAAEQSSRAKSVFLMSMSHELRTPLNAVLGFAELLKINDARPLDKDQARSIDHILNAGRYLLELVSDVIEMSRIESGEVALHIESVRIARVVDPCLSMVELSARQMHVTLVNECGGCADREMRADAVRLKQVLLNLLSNAVKYNKDGGSVTVSCVSNADGYLRISIADTGKGVPAGKRHELFQPFARLGVEAGAVQGAGLGLAMAKRLVEMMQGRIGFESVEGAGSTFWVELPPA